MKVCAKFVNRSFVLICVYAPTMATDRMLVLDPMGSVIGNCCSDEVMILGDDFNCTA